MSELIVGAPEALKSKVAETKRRLRDVQSSSKAKADPNLVNM
jgi:hypothetical protein